MQDTMMSCARSRSGTVGLGFSCARPRRPTDFCETIADAVIWQDALFYNPIHAEQHGWPQSARPARARKSQPKPEPVNLIHYHCDKFMAENGTYSFFEGASPS